MAIQFPNESTEYRKQREKLLQAEIDLRARIEQVAAMRRALPPGGRVAQDYAFAELEPNGQPVQRLMSELFAPGKDVLFIYGFMFGPEMTKPCPSCSSVIDALNANARHIGDRINLAVVARSPIERIQQFARSRGWTGIRLLSSAKNSFGRDYFAETADGNQMPMANVFVKKEGVVFHSWGTEMLMAPTEGHPRHVDLIWPLWNVFDMTPVGRGDYLPAL